MLHLVLLLPGSDVVQVGIEVGDLLQVVVLQLILNIVLGLLHLVTVLVLVLLFEGGGEVIRPTLLRPSQEPIYSFCQLILVLVLDHAFTLDDSAFLLLLFDVSYLGSTGWEVVIVV